MSMGQHPVGGALLAALLSLPTASSAVWTCHGAGGTSWQQENPPCVTPTLERIQQPRLATPEFNDSQRRPQQPSKVPATDSAPSWERSALIYDRVLSELEGRYPSINPDSPLYDQATLDRVVAAMKRRRELGMNEVAALQAATADVFTQPNTVPAPPVPATTYKMPSDSRLETALRGVLGGLAISLACFVLLKMLGFLSRSAGHVTRKAADVIDNTSAHDIARAAGGMAGVAQKKTSRLLEAFRAGKEEKL